MTRMDQPEVEIFTVDPHDNYRPQSSGRDAYDRRASPRRSNQRVDDDLPRAFQTLDIGERKDKDKNRRNSLVADRGRIMRRRSSSGNKPPARYYEFYHFVRRGEDWTLADRIPIKVSQEELAKKVAKAKSNKSTVLDQMKSMHYLRRDQINKLLEQKNYAENANDAEWVPMFIATTKYRGNKVLEFDLVIAQSFKPGRPVFRDHRNNFVGERSDLRETTKYKGKDKDKSKSKERKEDDYDYSRGQDHDIFGKEPVFTHDGRPINNRRASFGGQKAERRGVPLENPIAGPPPGLQPMRMAPQVGWNEPLPHAAGGGAGGGFFPDHHHIQGPVEAIPNNFQPHDAPADNGVYDLDQLLNGPPVDGGGGGGGGHNHQDFNQPRPDVFGEPPPVDFRPIGPERSRSAGRRKSGSRPRPNRINTDQGPPRRREHSRRHQYGDSSIDDPDSEVSVFFDGDGASSMSSLGDDHYDRFIERRGSLKRRPSTRREEPLYREHHRRGASYNPGRLEMVIEPGRTPRRPPSERRQTIAYVEPRRQITYQHRGGRDRDFNDVPLSPALTQRSYSPGPGRMVRRESRVPPPEALYPDEIREKDRWAEDYMDTFEREARYRNREDDLRRQERELDERDARRRSAKVVYVDHRDHRDYRPDPLY